MAFSKSHDRFWFVWRDGTILPKNAKTSRFVKILVEMLDFEKAMHLIPIHIPIYFILVV